MKYPKESLPKNPTNHIVDKKYGFFQTEKEAFKDIVKELGLIETKTSKEIGYYRHPLAYLVEAADDICYTIIDFEDGINLGLISEEFALEYLINLVRETININKYNQLTTTQDRVSYLRALAINTLINEAVDVFMRNEELILEGKFSTALLDKSTYEAQIKDIIKLSVSNIYQSKEVINKEVAGFEVLTKLLKTYIIAVNNNFENKATAYDNLILRTIPSSIDIKNSSLYQRLLNVCHYVASFSDSNAILIFNKIKGISF